MKLKQYITLEDWDSLGFDNQIALRDSLRFMGYRVKDLWFPEGVLRKGRTEDTVVGLYGDGDLALGAKFIFDSRFTLEEVLSFIDLTSFGVNE